MAKKQLRSATSKDEQIFAKDKQISKLNISLKKVKSQCIELDQQCTILKNQVRDLQNQVRDTQSPPFDVDDVSEISPKKSSSYDEESGAPSDASMQRKMEDVLAELMSVLEENQSESMNQTTLSQDEQDEKKKLCLLLP